MNIVKETEDPPSRIWRAHRNGDTATGTPSLEGLHSSVPVPPPSAVRLTAFDVMPLLALQGLGMRFIEALILVLVGTIGGCYFIEIFVLPQTHPDFAEMGQALLMPGFREPGMIVGAIGIIGATV